MSEATLKALRGKIPSDDSLLAADAMPSSATESAKRSHPHQQLYAEFCATSMEYLHERKQSVFTSQLPDLIQHYREQKIEFLKKCKILDSRPPHSQPPVPGINKGTFTSPLPSAGGSSGLLHQRRSHMQHLMENTQHSKKAKNGENDELIDEDGPYGVMEWMKIMQKSDRVLMKKKPSKIHGYGMFAVENIRKWCS